MESMELKHGDGCIVKLKSKQKDGTVKESRYWYLLYYANGRQIRENSKVKDYKEAYDMLQRRKGQLADGISPVKSRLVFRYEEMRQLLLNNYDAKNRYVMVSKDGIKNFRGRARMDSFFRGMAVADMDTAKINKYVERGYADGLKGPTIKRHLDCLGKMFTLAQQVGKIRNIPYIEKPANSEPAGIVIDPLDFNKIMAAMPEISRAYFIFQNQTACRPGATRKIDWTMVNKDCTEITLPASIIKTRLPLTLPLAGTELEKLSALLKIMDRKGLVFYSENYLKVWQDACIAAGLAHIEKRPGKKPLYVGPRVHDNRVAGARALVQSGVDPDTAMKVGGWKTQHVFSRYNIVTTRDVAAALRKRSPQAEQAAA